MSNWSRFWYAVAAVFYFIAAIGALVGGGSDD